VIRGTVEKKPKRGRGIPRHTTGLKKRVTTEDSLRYVPKKKEEQSNVQQKKKVGTWDDRGVGNIGRGG